MELYLYDHNDLLNFQSGIHPASWAGTLIDPAALGRYALITIPGISFDGRFAERASKRHPDDPIPAIGGEVPRPVYLYTAHELQSDNPQPIEGTAYLTPEGVNILFDTVRYPTFLEHAQECVLEHAQECVLETPVLSEQKTADAFPRILPDTVKCFGDYNAFGGVISDSNSFYYTVIAIPSMNKLTAENLYYRIQEAIK